MRVAATLGLLASIAAPALAACPSVNSADRAAVVGPNKAIQIAKAGWAASGKAIFSIEAVAKFEPYRGELKDGAWLVYGTPVDSSGRPMIGGTPEAEVCAKDAAVRIWHSQ